MIFAPVAVEVANAEVVGEDEDNVGTRLGRGLCLLSDRVTGDDKATCDEE